MTATLLTAALPALAAPFDYKYYVTNAAEDGVEEWNTPTRATSTAALLGGKPGADNESWFYVGRGLSQEPTSFESGIGKDNNYRLNVDLDYVASHIDVSGLQDGNGYFPKLLSSVSTTTYTAGIASLQSQISALPSTGIQADWTQASTTVGSYIKNKPSLAAIATTGAYSDLSGKPALATVATTGAYADLTGKPTLGIAYEGITQRTNSFPVFKSATVASGTAVFNLTADGTAGGTAICTNGVIQDSVNAFVSDATASYQMAYAFSNSNKTVTVTTNKLTTANILTGILGQAAGNGSAVKLSVWCY